MFIFHKFHIYLCILSLSLFLTNTTYIYVHTLASRAARTKRGISLEQTLEAFAPWCPSYTPVSM